MHPIAAAEHTALNMLGRQQEGGRTCQIYIPFPSSFLFSFRLHHPLSPDQVRWEDHLRRRRRRQQELCFRQGLRALPLQRSRLLVTASSVVVALRGTSAAAAAAPAVVAPGVAVAVVDAPAPPAVVAPAVVVALPQCHLCWHRAVPAAAIYHQAART